MRLGRVAFLGAVTVLSVIYRQEVETVVADALASPTGQELVTLMPGHAEIARGAQAIKTAHDGLGCLAGTTPCPGGRPSPFK